VVQFLAGGLRGEETSKVDDHLDSCPDCRQLLRAVAAVSASEQTLPASSLDTTMPADLGLTPTQPDVGAPIAPLANGVPRGTTIGRYIVLDILGSGGMGVVYAAFDPELDRKVAVKVLRTELAGEAAAARLLREGRAIAKLAHPNVVAVFDVGTHDGSVFIAMEMVDGMSLDRWITPEPRPWREAVSVMLQAGEGLAAAHSAGIIHRDFKPGNVLLGKDGRARVTDFGLARFDRDGGELALGSSPDAFGDGLKLTRTGAVVGTPAYMALEQFQAERVTEKSDQFAFAVALYEALYGQRPFEGLTLEAIMLNLETNTVRAVPASSRVPAWLRAIVLRGLRANPEERYPSLDEMLKELRRDPAVVRRRIAFAAVSLAALGSVVGLAVTRDRGAEVCAGARPKLERVWNAQQRAAGSAAFAATGKPYATLAWQATEQAIDRYSGAWVDMHVDACKATNTRREQSAAVLDLRMQCLDQRLDALRVNIDVLAHADVSVVNNASKITGHSDALTAGSVVDSLRERITPPSTLEQRAIVAGLREKVVRAGVLADAGKFRDGLAFMPGVVAAARTVGYRPLESDALRSLGDLQSIAGESAAAERTLDEAIVAAEASGDQLALGKAYKDLVNVVGLESRRYKDAVRLADHARAILERVEPDGVVLADLDNILSAVYREDGQFPEARAAIDRSIKSLERQLPAGSPRISRAYNSLANMLWVEDKLEEALAIFQRVKAELAASLGAQHPSVAMALSNISGVLAALGKRDESYAAAKEQLAIEQVALGPEHPDMISIYNKLGNVASSVGTWDEARGYFEHAIAIGEKAYGSAHPRINLVLVSMARMEDSRGNFAVARGYLTRALIAEETLHGVDSISTTTTLMNLANIERREGKLEDSKRTYERVLAIRKKALGPEHSEVADALIGLSNIESALGHNEGAIRLLEQALAIQEKNLGRDNPRLGITIFNLALGYHGLAKWREAEPLVQRARTMMTAQYGAEHPYTASVLVLTASTLDHLGRSAEALPLAEQAVAIHAKRGGGGQTIAEARDALARLVWKVKPAERARAASLAREALAGYTLDTPSVRENRKDLTAWMRANKITP